MKNVAIADDDADFIKNRFYPSRRYSKYCQSESGGHVT